MNDKERSSETLQQNPVVISDDTSSDKEESPTFQLTTEQTNSVVPRTESSTETQTKLLAENEVAVTNLNDKPMSESEIALRDLNNKLKEVQSKLNLNTPIKSNPNANNDKDATNNITEKNTQSGTSNEPLKEDKASFNHETTKALIVNVNSTTATASLMDSVVYIGAPKVTTLNVGSPTMERGSAGVLLTPQNEKEVAECWNSLGVQRCRFCKFSTNDKKLFEIHATTCTPKVIVAFSDGIYTCETCELTWTNKPEFEEHIVCHTTNDPYVCINCKKAFESRLLTEQHAKTDHPSGGSVYGLRGMKKSRKIVEELEIQGKHMFRGKLKIPPTPRNKQISSTTTQASDDVVKTGHSDGVHTPQMTDIAANSNTAAADQITSTNTSKGSSSKIEQSNKNSELIEQNMEQLRQFLISQGSMAGVSDSKGTVQDNQSSSLNENVKTSVTTVTHLSSSIPSQNSILMKDQNLVPAVSNSVSISGAETGATLHYQTSQKQADQVITIPSQKAPNIPVASVCQPVSTSLVSATSILNKTGPPNVVINRDFMSKETGSERVTASVGNQYTGPQQQRQYLFTEYIHPPPPRPKIPVPSSVRPFPTVQTTVQTGTAVAAPTSVQTGAAVGVPSAVQTNSAPILLIPIPPVFNNPVSTLSNVLIPIPAAHQANQNLVKSFVNYSLPNTASSGSTSSSKPNMAGQVVHPPSQIAPTSPSERPILFNTFVNSKPQLLLTSNSFATQPTISRFTPSVQGQQSASKTATTVMKSLLDKMVEKSVSVASSTVNMSASSSQSSKKTSGSTPLLASAIKDPIPTVEIFLPDKTHGHQKDNSQKNDSNNISGTQFNLSKRFLFRIRPGHGFVCEACRKFTQDEVIFRRHVWDHFHTVTRSCKFCSQDKVTRKDFMNCKLVSNVVCSLVKKSTNQGKSHAEGVTPEKAISVVDDEVIAISDEEDNTKAAEPVLMETNDVIILDEEEDSTNNQNSEIKIASTYSLNDTEKQSKDGPYPVEDAHSEKEGAENIKPGKSVIKDVVENDKSVTISDQNDEVNTKTSNKSKLSSKTEEVTAVSILENVEKDANEQIHGEKHSAAKDSSTAKVSRDEIQRFERRVLSTRKEFAFYMCGFDQCSFTSLKSKHYKEHLTANHSGASFYVCCHCGLKNYTEDAHIRHINSHANMKVFLLFNCPFRPCKYKTNLMHMFKEHLLSHKEDIMKCTYCHKTFESVELLISHLKANLIKFVSCSHCQFKFQLKDMVAKHIKLAHQEKPRIVVVSSQILCMERELNFYSPPLAKARATEKQIVQGVEEFTSLAGDLNSAAFYSSDNQQNEIVSNSLISSGSIPDDDHNEVVSRGASSPPPPVLTAEFTGGKQNNVSGAEKNSEQTESIQNDTSNAEPPRSLMCSKCNFISWNYKLHQQHLNLHETDEPEREKRFVCMYCPKGFDVFNPFKTHVSNHVGHHEIKIYCCTLCVFTTSQRYHIIDHCKDNHLGTGTYFQKTDIVVSKESSCKYCDFKSRQAEQVQLHEKIVHINPSSKQNKKTDSSKQADEQRASASQSETEPGETEPVNTESSDHNQKNRKYHCHYCMEYFKHKADLRSHMQSSHLDIENKSFVTFKCKYCHFTSTMKALIMTHIDRKHANEQIRILRRIENVDTPKTDAVSGTNVPVKEDKTTYRCEMCNLSMDSSEKFKKHFSDKHANDDSEQLEMKQTEKETVYIPDGNIFKEAFECPKCSYSNRLRVNILRHIKEHPELVPSRSQAATDTSPSKVTARKSTSKVLPVKAGEKLFKNPFAAVKDAVRELDKTDADSSKELEQLSLGGDFLHSKLSECFIPLEKDYKCRICQQNIVKKFVLHRHILNHLQVVFFKCHYCQKGDIEQSLLSGHIQQEHSLKQVKLDYFKVHEICNEIKDRISNQNFSDSVPLPDIHGSQNIDDSRNNVDIVRKQIHEADQKDDKNEKEISIFKCSKCDYYAKNEYFLKLHRNDHINPGSKKYGCTVCGYRGIAKQHILRHMKTVHPNHPLKYTVLGNNAGDNGSEVKTQDGRSEDNVISKQSSNKKVSGSGGGRVLATESGTKKVKGNVIRSDNITISEAGVFDMKTLYKCKECGEKTKAKWAMYDHFKNSKCHRRWYRCECCAFSNPFKNAITKHAKIRHPGKKVKIIELPLSAKMRLIKIPVKQNKQILKAVEGPGNSHGRQKNATCSESKGSKIGSSFDSVASEIHTCRLCSNYKSDSLSKLQFHLNTKHQGKPLFCTKCNYKTPLVKHIINHCQNVHKMEIAQYSLHEQEDGGTEDETENVERTVVKKKNDQIKQSKSVETSNKKYKCPNCNISKDKIKSLRDHMQIHFSYKPYICKYCSKRQQHFNNVKRHVNICHSGLEVKYSMVKDEKIESKLDRLVAQVLKQSSTGQSVKASPKETETHIRKKADKRSRDSDEDIQPSKKKRPVIETDDESNEESSVDDRSRPSHVKYRVMREPGTSTKLYQCVQCDFNTDKKDSLHGHLKKHVKKSYKCCYCGYKASYRSYVVKHSRRVHKEKPLKVVDQESNEVLSPKRRKVEYDSSSESSADESGLAFETSKKMVTLKYFCNFCDYAVTGLYHFRQHLATHKEFRYLRKGTEIESRLSCGYCSYMAIDDADFSKHISDHLDERPYKCGHCDYSSYQRNKIQQHLTVSHPEEEEIILDNKDIDRDTFKGKQVMLVDFDPQVVLKRLKTDYRLVDDEYSTKQVSEKLKSLVTKPSPSKANFEPGNIFMKLSNADSKLKNESGSDERTDILAKENKIVMEGDANKSDFKDKGNMPIVSYQKQELDSTKSEIIKQPVKTAEDVSETNEQLSDIKSNRVSNQKLTLDQQDSLERDICQSEIEDKYDGRQQMEAASYSESKMENESDSRDNFSEQCSVNITESEQKMNSENDTDIAVDVLKSNEDLLGNSVKNLSAIDRDELSDNVQSGESFKKETEKLKIDDVHENTQTDDVQKNASKNGIHIKDTVNTNEPLMVSLSCDQPVKPVHAQATTGHVLEDEMNYEDDKQHIGDHLQKETELMLDRPESSDLDVNVTDDRYSLKSAEDTNTMNTATTKFSDADQENDSEEIVVSHNKESYTSEVNTGEESENFDGLALEASDDTKEGIDNRTDTPKSMEKAQKTDYLENLGDYTDNETQNFEIYDESQPFDYGESQSFDYVKENEMIAGSEEQIDTKETEQCTKLVDGTIMNSGNVLECAQTKNILTETLTCSFQDRNEDFGNRQDTVDDESKQFHSKCTSELRCKLLPDSERPEITTDGSVDNDMLSNSTDTADYKLDSISIKHHMATELETKESDDEASKNSPLCTSDRHDENESQSEILVNGSNCSKNEKIESLYTEIESLCTEIENRVDKTEMNSDKNTIHSDVKPEAFIYEKSETLTCCGGDAVESVNSRNESRWNEMENIINKSEISTEKNSNHRDTEPEASVLQKSENDNCFGKDVFESNDTLESVTECDQNDNEHPAGEVAAEINDEYSSVVVKDHLTERSGLVSNDLPFSEAADANHTDTTDLLQLSGTTEVTISVEMEKDNVRLRSKETDHEISECVDPINDASRQSVHSDHGSYTKY